jgi:glutamine cyclotransferase
MLTITANGVPVKNLNELEIINGELWANVWQTDSIARINLQTGVVTGWIDCSSLLTPEERSGIDVLNGIAYDAKRDVILLGWKNCSKMFEVRLKSKEKM